MNYLRHQAIFELSHYLPFDIEQTWRIKYEEYKYVYIGFFHIGTYFLITYPGSGFKLMFLEYNSCQKKCI